MRVFSWDPTEPLREVDLFVDHPLPFDELWARSELVELGASRVRIASIPDLIALKRLANRSQDLQDIEAHVKKLLAKVIPATVGLRIGGSSGSGVIIDEYGQPIEHLDGSFTVSSPRPEERLREVIGLGSHHYYGPQGFGLFRTSALQSVPPGATHVAWDRSLLAELSLLGRFVEVPEELFFYRTHPQQASSSFQTRAQLWTWHDPSKANRIVFPNMRLGRDYLEAVRRVPITAAERRRCYAVLARWPVHYWKLLVLDILRAGSQASALIARRA